MFYSKYLKNNICFTHQCIQCCIKTSMFLTNNDIETIRKEGYEPKDFFREKNGWLMLKNREGKCVFHNGLICLIYQFRPEGCRLYPRIFDDELNISVIDDDCPFGDEFEINTNDIKHLSDLIQQLKKERKQRLP